MIRAILWAISLALTVAGSLDAQDALSELNGTNFYFYQRDRVLNLQDYRRSLDNLVMQGGFNPETRHPWTKQDAEARWAQVQKQATTDQANCAAVASLPALRKQLQDLQQQPSAPAGAAKK